MTRRKPPTMNWSSWIDQQIEEARAKGAFDNLPGEGKPLADLDEVYDPAWWAKKWVKREQISLLPPALAIRQKVERGLKEIWELREEAQVREKLAELNAQIGKANATVTSGPPTQIGLLDVADVVGRWRAQRGERGEPR